MQKGASEKRRSGLAERLRAREEVDRALRREEHVAWLVLRRRQARVGAAEVVREAVLELLHAVDLVDLLLRELDRERLDVVVEVL